MNMKTMVTALLILALAVPAVAQVPGMWAPPEGECTYPGGMVVTDPGIIPLPCDPIAYCVAWDAAEECVEMAEYTIPGCAAMNSSPEYRTAVIDWLADKMAWNWCVLLDYWGFVGSLGR